MNGSSVLVSLDLLAHVLCCVLCGLHCLADASPRGRVASIVLCSIAECIIQRVNHSLYHSLYRHRPRPLKDVLNHSLSDFGDWVLKTPIPACNRIRRLREGNGPINAERYKAQLQNRSGCSDERTVGLHGPCRSIWRQVDCLSCVASDILAARC